MKVPNVYRTWQCSACTLENPMAKRRCQVCQARRGVDENFVESADPAVTQRRRKRKRSDQEEPEIPLESYKEETVTYSVEKDSTKDLNEQTTQASKPEMDAKHDTALKPMDSPHKIFKVAFHKAGSNEIVEVTSSSLERAKQILEQGGITDSQIPAALEDDTDIKYNTQAQREKPHATFTASLKSSAESADICSIVSGCTFTMVNKSAAAVRPIFCTQ